MHSLSFKNYVLALFIFLVGFAAQAERIKDMATIAGQRGNQLIGYGLVVGLDGTGESNSLNPITGQSISNMLASLGVTVPVGQNVQMRNVATVMVTAELPALARPGQLLDVTVSSMGNTRSLKGGTLLMTPLRAANGQVYAQAQGSVVVPGAAVASVFARTTVNQLAAGRIPSGAFVEQGAPEADTGPVVELNFRRADFAQTRRAMEVMANLVGAQSVIPVDARNVLVRVPVNPTERMNVMADLLELEVPNVAEAAKVVINARTGSVVMNQAVQLAPFAVTHGNLTLKVQAINQVVQPAPGTFRGRPMVQRNDRVSIDAGPTGGLVRVEEGASLDQVVRALNLLGATPQDLMAILQAMKASGSLKAELEII